MTKRNAWLLIILSCIGLFVFMRFQSLDPSIHQDLDAMTSEEAVTRSSQHWRELGVKVNGLEVTVTLEGAGEVDGYLNRYDLYEEYRQHAPEQAPLAFWKVTFYEAEGSNTYISKVGYTSGRLVAYQIVSDESAQAIAEEQARQLAATALGRIGIEPHPLERSGPADSDAQEDATRRFLVANQNFKLEGLTQRFIVETTGDRVTRVDYEYITPESFQVWREWQTTIGTLLTALSMLLSFALLVVAFVFLFVLKQKKPYQSALWLSLLLFVLFLLSNLNQWPLFKQQVLAEGGGSMSVLVAGSFAVLAVVIFSLLVAAATYPMILTGGMLVGEVNPRLWTSWHDPQHPAILRRAVWYGYLLAMLWLGLQAVFYWLGETYFEVWYEQDFTMSSSNMWWPLLFPLLAWLAGIQEEVTYRLFGVTFFKRYLKNSLVAVLVPGMIWALGHSLYPVYPIYTRFVELTIFGILIGFCYLWFGIETVIMAHVIFDTVLMCIPLLLSGEALQVGCAVAYLFLPILVGYGLGRFRPRPKEQISSSS